MVDIVDGELIDVVVVFMWIDDGCVYVVVDL